MVDVNFLFHSIVSFYFAMHDDVFNGILMEIEPSIVEKQTLTSSSGTLQYKILFYFGEMSRKVNA